MVIGALKVTKASLFTVIPLFARPKVVPNILFWVEAGTIFRFHVSALGLSWEMGAGGTGSWELSYLDLGAELGQPLEETPGEPRWTDDRHSQ